MTGAYEGGGGNNVDESGFGRRAYYGDKGLAVIQKIAQLQGNAWLERARYSRAAGQSPTMKAGRPKALDRLSRAQVMRNSRRR